MRCIFFAPALLALSSTTAVHGAIHEALGALPFGWTPASESVSAKTMIKLQVALRYQNLDQIDQLLASVSTPGSGQYGEYLDAASSNEIFAPSKQSENAVKNWLVQSGARSIISDGTIISFSMSVGQADRLLNSSFQAFTNGERTAIRTMRYSIPDHLSEHVDFVAPTVYFDNTKAHSVLPEAASGTDLQQPTKRQVQPSCQTSVLRRGVKVEVLTPLCVQQLYNTVDYKADPHSGSTLAFGNFLNESASYSDLALFEKAFNIPSQNFTVLALINGGVDDQNPLTETDGEANLDVQNIIGLADGLPVYAYITGGSPPFQPDLLAPNASENQNEPYLPYFHYLLSQPNSRLPYVITNSYGDHENTVPERYARRVCNMIGMLGIRGRTILESSGDEGVGAVCRDNSGSNLEGQVQFTPQFPATCPYITAVGGTQVLEPVVEAWNGSSGGFSFYFDQPWYQKDAVKTYLDKYISEETKTYYSSNNFTNFGGRGFPDVSAHSLYPRYAVYVNSTAVGIGGTSAASPVVAAIFALLNDARFRAGKPAIGFANPWLYGYAADALNDITHGGAVGCAGINLQSGLAIEGAGVIPYASWNATVGWDPVTGLGTPNFQLLKDAALRDCSLPHGPKPVWGFPPHHGGIHSAL